MPRIDAISPTTGSWAEGHKENSLGDEGAVALLNAPGGSEGLMAGTSAVLPQFGYTCWEIDCS